MVFATVVLAILGVSGGLSLGAYHKRTAVPCPEKMLQTAGAQGFSQELTQVLRVRAVNTGTTVWICEDPSGGLYYQSNRGGEDATWVEGQTALFLSGVTRVDGAFQATAPDGNTFTVDEHTLTTVVKGESTAYAVRAE